MCGGFHNEAEATSAAYTFSPKVLEHFLRKLYDGDFDTSTEIEPTAWREVLRILNDAVAEGFAQSGHPPTLESDFYAELRQSNGVFAAFKVHSMAEKMAALLTDDEGKLKPFHQWKAEVESIATHYVGPWLRTEYNTAVIRAHNAADWLQFERNRDIMPNLRWMPTTSPNPEAEHKRFWEKKLTRPIDDPFWNKHRPGDRWNCKCSLEATDEPITPIPDDADDEKPQRGLKGNPAKTGQIFDKSHPYFPKNCASCGFNPKKGTITSRMRGWFNAGNMPCKNCKVLNYAINKAKDLGDIAEMIKNLGNLRGAEYAKQAMLITKHKRFEPVEKNIHSATGKGVDYDRLISAARKAVEWGCEVYLLPNPGGTASADLILFKRGVYKVFELKTVSGKNSVGNRLFSSREQARRVFLNMPGKYNTRNLAADIKDYFEQNDKALEVLVVVGGKKVSVERDYALSKTFYQTFRKSFR